MKKLLSLLFLTWCYSTMLAQKVPVYQTQPNGFKYTLSASGLRTSAGVYTATDTTLIRTLWSNRPDSIGTHTRYWDGKDDDGNAAPAWNYLIKVESNGIAFTWEGGKVGNTSDSLTGSKVWNTDLGYIGCMKPIGSYMYYGATYSEGSISQGKFLLTQPQERLFINSLSTFRNTNQATFYIASNSNYILYAGKDFTATGNFVFGINASTEAISTFSHGVPYIANFVSYASTLDLNTVGANGLPTGMDVQQSGSQYLFVAHGPQNKINVYNLSTGGNLAQNITITNPTALILENDANLWVGQGTTLTKYTVNSDGTITSTGIQIVGFAAIQRLAIIGNKIAVADGGNQQVVKFYNTTTLASMGNLGTVGGYANSPVITNTKFYWNDLRQTYPTFLAFQSDTSIWVGDPGNCRYQHFDKTGTFINNIAALQGNYSYSTNIVQGNPNSVLGALLEFQIDYTQPLASGWTLVNNWGYNYNYGLGTTSLVFGARKFSNGRTYVLLRANPSANLVLAELQSGVGLRVCPGTFANFPAFDNAGNLTYIAIVSGNRQYVKYPFLGTFDGSNNPQYGTPVNIGSPINIGTQYPAPSSALYQVTSNNNLITYNNSVNNTYPYKIAGYNLTHNKFKFRTRKITFRAYAGDYPQQGQSDIGNQINFGEGSYFLVGNYFVGNYHGENWKAGETCILNLFDASTGLFLGMGGTVSASFPPASYAPYAFSGNSLTTSPALVSNVLYAYLGDESAHNAIHRWAISNLSSISVQTIPLTLDSRPFTITPTSVDELAGIPDNQSSLQGTPGWTQSVADIAGKFYSKSRLNTLDFSKTADISFFANISASSSTLYNWTKTITTNTGLSHWQLSGTMAISGNSFIEVGTNFYITINDASGKVLAKFIFEKSGLYMNSTLLSAVPSVTYGASDFVIKRDGSHIRLLLNLFGNKLLESSQTIFDGTGDISSPRYLTINYLAGGVALGVNIGFNSLVFE